MSKGIKTIANIALPHLGFVGGFANGLIQGEGLGGALKQGVGSAIQAGATIFGGPIGGAVGGAVNAKISGRDPIGGAISGYAGANAVDSIVGSAAGTPLAGAGANGLPLQGPTLGSGISGAVTGGGIRALGNTAAGAASGLFEDPSTLLLSVGNQLMTNKSAAAAEEAARIQSGAVDKAISQQQPYSEFGEKAINKINTIQNDPAGYIKNNSLYTSLAADAERRLLASEASKGKVGSGGTAAALQDRLLQIGNGLVQQEISNLQTQVGTGQTAANNTSGLLTGQGVAQSAGIQGKNNAYQTGYENQINTLLALQNLNKVPSYVPVGRLAA